MTVKYAEAVEMLGKDNVLEACRFFARRNLHAMPDVTVEDATKDIIDHAETEFISKTFKDTSYAVFRVYSLSGQIVDRSGH